MAHRETTQSSRRTFLSSACGAGAAIVAVPSVAYAGSSHRALARRSATGANGFEGPSPYGALRPSNVPGVDVAQGFSVRVVAVGGEPVPGTDFVWRSAADGAAVFPAPDGGWFHAVNHEISDNEGGVSVLRFSPDGTVSDAWSILDGTNRNCAGGPTPWGSWLSCEEVSSGLVYECDPTQPSSGVARPALGLAKHEAVAVDPIRKRLFLTEDETDSLLYRFTPDSWPSLDTGLLEAAAVDGAGLVWLEVPDPGARARALRYQFDQTMHRFAGGEGIWYHDDHVFFTTKGDQRVWELNVVDDALRVIWQGDATDPERDQLTGVDNITVDARTGDLFVAEDGGNMELVIITATGEVAPFLHLPDERGSEITGPVFNPSGDTLYFSSQRGGPAGRGVTYAVTGPFRGIDAAAALSQPGMPVRGAALDSSEPTSATAVPETAIPTPFDAAGATDPDGTAASAGGDGERVPGAPGSDVPTAGAALDAVTNSSRSGVVLGGIAAMAAVGLAAVAIRRRNARGGKPPAMGEDEVL